MKSSTNKLESLRRICLMCFLILFSFMKSYAAQGSKGNDFWLTFPGNNSQDSFITLFIAGDEATTGTVTIPGLAFTAAFTVTPGTVTSVMLPTNVQLQSSNTIQNLGIHITANNDVTVYGLNRKQASTDAFLALPTDILGTEYINLGYKNVNVVNASQLAIVATTNSTNITIVPSVTTDGHTAGVPYSITLNQGQTYLLRNRDSAPSDLTGTKITSNHPIAVFGGHACANIPSGEVYCDYIVEQLPPTSAWGKQFVTVPLATRQNGDTFRFLASVNNTQVKVNGIVVATLNNGQYHEQIINGAAEIVATEPILVAQYSNSTTYDGVVSDPFMMLIPPFEQFLGNYTVSTPASGFSGNYINIVAPNASIGTVTLDGVPIPASSFTPIGSTGFSGAQLNISLGTHIVNGVNYPIGSFVYGFDNADSYGYPGGMSLAPIAQVTSISLTPKTANTPRGSDHCVKATVLDQDGNPLEGIRVDFTVSGANSTTGFANTDASGVAEYCYRPANDGSDNIVASVGSLSDNATNEVGSSCTAPVLTMPSIAPVLNVASTCGASVPFEATATGTPEPSIVYTILVNGQEEIITSPHTFPVGTTTVTATATSDCGTDSETFTVTVTNDAPVLSAITPSTFDPVQINTAITTSASYTDNNLQTATWDWGDGTTSSGSIGTGTITGSKTYGDPGVYTVGLTVTDACNSSTFTTYQYIVVFDPSGGFVTGGGWIDSPAGAYRPDGSLEGRANFGFVSKYQKGAKIPTGHTNFQFQVADLHFSSTSYEWLVVSGATARYKGVGTINGSGNYGFILSAIDGQVTGGGGYDKFRIKIWDKNNNDLVVYDNNLGDGSDDAFAETMIGGGSIVVHEALKASGGKKLTSTDGLEVKSSRDFYTYPTAFSDRTTIAFSLDREEDYTLEVFDVRGALVKRIANGTAEANKVYEFELRGDGMAEGVYITRLTTSTKIQSLKSILKR
ncbi:PKD domain-containing protein [uncultured Pontibacter sp.]|uniref:PKD domain-containing protein n=1 Tax=uncultured Pontibacter sp. TaxID=453356 RepID=UPI0026099C5B|nr:PKD domain-containing protein [uncultured Pontibacter sp.]